MEYPEKSNSRFELVRRRPRSPTQVRSIQLAEASLRSSRDLESRVTRATYYHKLDFAAKCAYPPPRSVIPSSAMVKPIIITTETQVTAL